MLGDNDNFQLPKRCHPDVTRYRGVLSVALHRSGRNDDDLRETAIEANLREPRHTWETSSDRRVAAASRVSNSLPFQTSQKLDTGLNIPLLNYCTSEQKSFEKQRRAFFFLSVGKIVNGL